MNSICGINCMECELSGTCNGCAATGGYPLGAECLVAQCCKRGETALNQLKEKLIAAFKALHISDMEEVTELNALKGSFANIEYALPNGQIVKFWDDNKIYLGNQLHKYGGAGGSESPQIPPVSLRVSGRRYSMYLAFQGNRLVLNIQMRFRCNPPECPACSPSCNTHSKPCFYPALLCSNYGGTVPRTASDF